MILTVSETISVSKQQHVQIYLFLFSIAVYGGSKLKFSFRNRSNFSVGGAFKAWDNYVVNEQMSCDLLCEVFFQLSSVF